MNKADTTRRKYAGVPKSAVAPSDKKPINVTIMETSGKLLRIKEDIPNGYYIGADEDGKDHLYAITVNSRGIKVIGYVTPANHATRCNILGRIALKLPFEQDKEICYANYDGVYKEILGYRFDQLVFDRCFRGYFVAWVEPNKSGTGIVYRDLIKYGSQLRIIVSDAQKYPQQMSVYHSKLLTIYAMQGVFLPHSKEFDVSGQHGKPVDIVLRIDDRTTRNAVVSTGAAVYQRIVKVSEARIITYLVIPIIVNNKPFMFDSLFRKGILGTNKRSGTGHK
jgi:hypothetical protein